MTTPPAAAGSSNPLKQGESRGALSLSLPGGPSTSTPTSGLQDVQHKRPRTSPDVISNKCPPIPEDATTPSSQPPVQKSPPIVSGVQTDRIKPQLKEEVTNEVITIIKNCSLTSKSWTTIAHALGLTDRVHDIRFRVLHHGEDLNMCIVYLLKTWLEMSPKSATLSKLIEVLRSESFNRVADQLTDILYGKP